MGHILTAEGLKPDPKKVEAVRKMQKPTNKTELQIYLGMVTYLRKFIAQLSTVTAPLQILLEKTTGTRALRSCKRWSQKLQY